MSENTEVVFQGALVRGVLLERSTQKWLLVSFVDPSPVDKAAAARDAAAAAAKEGAADAEPEEDPAAAPAAPKVLPPKDYCLSVQTDVDPDVSLVAPCAVDLVDLQVERKQSRNGFVKYRAKCASLRAVPSDEPAPESGPVRVTSHSRMMLVSRAPGRKALVLRNLNSSAFMLDAKWSIKELVHLAGNEPTTPVDPISFDRFTQWSPSERSLFDPNHARDFSRVLRGVFTAFELGHRDWPNSLTQELFLKYVQAKPPAHLLPPPKAVAAVTVGPPPKTTTLNRFAMLNMGDEDEDEDEDDEEDEEKRTKKEEEAAAAAAAAASAATASGAPSDAPVFSNTPRWSLPGGKLDGFRDAWDTARQELTDEVGVRFSDLARARELAVRVDVPLFESKWVVASTAVFVVPTSTALDVQPRRQNSEFIESKWADAAFFSSNELQDVFPRDRVAEKSPQECLAALWAAAGAPSDPSVDLVRVKTEQVGGSSPSRAAGAKQGATGGKAGAAQRGGSASRGAWRANH